jgi:type IV secretion system protein VirB9
MIRFLLLASVIACTALPAQARDSRLVTRAYAPDEVIRIDGRAGVQATIAFGQDEHIENVAIGDSNSWQVTPNKRANLLFVKPLAARARTNLTVITDQRSYYFDLVASPAAHALYLLRFTYPDAPRATGSAATQTAALTKDEAAVINEPAAKPVDTSRLNFGWKQKGSKKLLPNRIYDDGYSTFLAWQPGRAVPAVLIRNEKGAEGPVNYAVRDDVMMIEGVPSQIVLRSGRDSAILEYGRSAPAPAASAQPSITKTASADQPRGQ